MLGNKADVLKWLKTLIKRYDRNCLCGSFEQCTNCNGESLQLLLQELQAFCNQFCNQRRE